VSSSSRSMRRVILEGIPNQNSSIDVARPCYVPPSRSIR
jgi:hypothetical protein